MNSLKNLETMLRGFPPRRPSPKVRAALFGRTRLRPELAADARPLHLWFAPLAATAVCTLSIATVLLPATHPAARAFAAAAAMPSTPWESPVVQVERNAPPRPSFHSTTRATVASSFGSLLLRQTNVLVR